MRIAIVDDEAGVRDALCAILATYGHSVTGFASAADLMESSALTTSDCVLLDVMMPDMDGLAALSLIRVAQPSLPVIMITGHGDVAMAVRAMKDGARDFIQKPIDDLELDRTLMGIAKMASTHTGGDGNAAELRQLYATLSEREMEVMALVAAGHSSLSIGEILGISKKTADHHRASVMAKMQATSIAQLVRQAMTLGL
jgi:FixJ family two-component response regulator